ncbi:MULTISPECIES: hypothetical protein [Pantoea]|uniref:hypothetical protein n=1 Tax=Pantoea TaxID=53335 RepID=UPI0011315080|nr:MULTISPECIES: hypothetical protein [Pantoea]QZY94285.1 hypothetical protein K7X52_16430 [Pantoea dispersa]
MNNAKCSGLKRAVNSVTDIFYFGTADAIILYLLIYMLAAGGSYLMLKPHGGWPAIIAVNIGVYTLNQIISRVYKNDEAGILVGLTYLLVTLFPLFHLFFWVKC